jgi:hypothetical protein
VRRPLLALALAVTAAAMAAAPAQAAKRSVPQGFYGAIWAGDIETAPDDVRARAWDRLALAGVESVRVVFNWELAQPHEGGATQWERTDRVVSAAATRGISLMPTVMHTPNWAKQYPGVVQSPPTDKHFASYAAFVGELAKRYGPSGTFWSANPGLPKRPVRHWQIWNEPELSDHWWRKGGQDTPWAPKEARRYGALVRAADRALAAADPGGKIVLAGMTNYAWETLARLQRSADVRGHFDIAAVHMFPGKWRNVTVIVKRFREALDKGGGRKVPIWVTEMTWPAAEGRAQTPPWAETDYYRSFVTTEKGAAARLKGAYGLLAQRSFRTANRVQRVHWFTSLSSFRGNVIWDYSGLLRLDGSSIAETPVYAAYRDSARKHEGCVKTAAGRCR